MTQPYSVQLSEDNDDAAKEADKYITDSEIEYVVDRYSEALRLLAR